MRIRRLFRGFLVMAVILLTLAPLSTRAAYPIAGTWTTTGAMHQARGFQTAALLPSGLVLVAGGCNKRCDTTVNLASAELYHPHTGSWASTGSMHEPRIQFTATLLRDGQVLVAGGCRTADCSIILAGAELYNPRTGTWTLTGSMHEPRTLHTATLLSDGRVLVAGGLTSCSGRTCSPILASAELYDPHTGTWLSTGAMHQARDRHTATLLPDGRVLVAGGAAGIANNASGNPRAGAELYDPRTGTWALTGAMRQPRVAFAATLLHSGQVLIAGGSNTVAGTLQAELYDPRTGTWRVTGSLHQVRDYETGEAATLLPGGKVLIAGNAADASGNALASAELYDPRTGKWTLTGSLHQARVAQTTTLLPSGLVLVAGGSRTIDGSTALASAEVYQP